MDPWICWLIKWQYVFFFFWSHPAVFKQHFSSPSSLVGGRLMSSQRHTCQFEAWWKVGDLWNPSGFPAECSWVIFLGANLFITRWIGPTHVTIFGGCRSGSHFFWGSPPLHHFPSSQGNAPESPGNAPHSQVWSLVVDTACILEETHTHTIPMSLPDISYVFPVEFPCHYRVNCHVTFARKRRAPVPATGDARETQIGEALQFAAGVVLRGPFLCWEFKVLDIVSWLWTKEGTTLWCILNNHFRSMFEKRTFSASLSGCPLNPPGIKKMALENPPPSRYRCLYQP